MGRWESGRLGRWTLFVNLPRGVMQIVIMGGKGKGTRPSRLQRWVRLSAVQIVCSPLILLRVRLVKTRGYPRLLASVLA